MDYQRIRYILTPEELEDKRVVVVGLGSGGAPIVQHLAMNGVKNWALFDPDCLEEHNLVKHPGLRGQIGMLKTEVMCEWLKDRNHDSDVALYPIDVINSPEFEEEVQSADLVISATDSRSAREYINEVCVRHSVPCVVGDLFRTGVGGQVFSYIPGVTGCHNCLDIVSEKLGWNSIDSHIEMTDDEKERWYGLDEREYKASGLSMDIAIISAIFARTALRILLENPNPKFYPDERANYIIFYNRRLGDNLSLSSQKFLIAPQVDCTCSIRESTEQEDESLDFVEWEDRGEAHESGI